jgi:ATP phosphoribosyltransferase
MKTTNNAWTKKELETYILLLCANADENEAKEELDMIKRKLDSSTFEKIYGEFSLDAEEQRLEKINRTVQRFNYSHMELIALRKEMDAIYFVDEKYGMMERNLDRILDSIIY